MNPAELEVAKKVFIRNAFFSHPENVLVSMLCDDEPRIRIEAVKRMLDLRNNQLSSEVGSKMEVSRMDICGKIDGNNVMPTYIRPFRLPKLNFQAQVYTELFNWDITVITEPPLIRNITDNELKDIYDTPLSLPRYMCHNQPVERSVKVVTEASNSVCGEENRDGFIRQRLKSRRLMPCTNSKQDFSIHFS